MAKSKKERDKAIRSFQRYTQVLHEWRYMLPEDRNAFLRKVIRKALPVELEEIEEMLQSEKQNREIKSVCQQAGLDAFDQLLGRNPRTQVDRLNDLLNAENDEA